MYINLYLRLKWWKKKKIHTKKSSGAKIIHMDSFDESMN